MNLFDTSDGNETIHADSTKMIDYKISMEQIKNHAEESSSKRSKGGFFGRNRE